MYRVSPFYMKFKEKANLTVVILHTRVKEL